MKKTFLSVILANLIYVLMAQFQVSEIANVTAPGTLNIVAKKYFSTVHNLTIIGIINARDFKTMRDSMPNLAVLNLTNTTIVSYSGMDGPSISDNDTYPANAIPQYAFYVQSTLDFERLKSISLPMNITIIGDSAFMNCYELSDSLILPSSVTYIGKCAFSNCNSLTGTITIPSSVTYIGDNAFSGCSGLKGRLTIPSSVDHIGTGAFSGGFTSIIVDKSNPSFCSLNGVLFNKSETAIIECPGGMKGTYSIPSTVTCIGDGAFEGCSGLNGSVQIPSSVTYIGKNAFAGCSGLKGSITIPSSVSYIGDYAFYGCTGLISLKDLNSSPLKGSSMGSDVFFGDNLNNLYVPSGSVNAYKTDTNWNLINILPINKYALHNMSGNFKINFPNPCNILYQITIMDTTGNKIFYKTKTRQNFFIYTGKKLPSGIYEIRFEYPFPLMDLKCLNTNLDIEPLRILIQ